MLACAEPDLDIIPKCLWISLSLCRSHMLSNIKMLKDNHIELQEESEGMVSGQIVINQVLFVANTIMNILFKNIQGFKIIFHVGSIVLIILYLKNSINKNYYENKSL